MVHLNNHSAGLGQQRAVCFSTLVLLGCEAGPKSFSSLPHLTENSIKDVKVNFFPVKSSNAFSLSIGLELVGHKKLFHKFVVFIELLRGLSHSDRSRKHNLL